ncbi:serine hydrolase [Pseudonocardia sp. T1-2H]|uniref:serine hydrolase n=1 Tax=Pseudonocardia sp. T1-2H TaxID=3128899 RepID=UPI0040538914
MSAPTDRSATTRPPTATRRSRGPDQIPLTLRESGRLDFDAPVAQFCPEFADLQVFDGFDGDTPRLRAPRTQATVRNLVTHTSGLGYCPGRAKGRDRRLGRPVQHALLGRPHQRYLRVDLHQLAAVRHTGGVRALRRVRAGPLRLVVRASS